MGPERFTIDTSKISDSERAQGFKKGTIEWVLTTMEKNLLKPFGPGDLVVMLDGPHAYKGLMVAEKRDDGMVRVLPAPGAPAIEIEALKLFHLDDYHEAFKVALVEEQNTNFDQPQ